MLHREEIYDLYSSPNTIWMIYSRRMRGLWWGNVRERDHLEYVDVDKWIILKWLFKKLDGGLKLD